MCVLSAKRRAKYCNSAEKTAVVPGKNTFNFFPAKPLTLKSRKPLKSSIDQRFPSATIREQKFRIDDLERKVQALVSGHVALIGAVQIAGGSAGLQQFWNTYQALSQELDILDAKSDPATVVDIRRKYYLLALKTRGRACAP